MTDKKIVFCSFFRQQLYNSAEKYIKKLRYLNMSENVCLLFIQNRKLNIKKNL